MLNVIPYRYAGILLQYTYKSRGPWVLTSSQYFLLYPVQWHKSAA
jgi:hypothetical protein